MSDWQKKGRLTFQETMGAINVKSRQTIYKLLSEGKLTAHNPNGLPGQGGTQILTSSVIAFLKDGTISKDKWNE